ncbi:MAG: TonB-dependent receptor, partial [Bacteroidota bacterium]|nr:TonB-dependent receptor [Bacteroidota bacterium]
MLRNLLLTIGVILTTSLFVFSQSGSLKGKIVDKDTKEPIPFANIIIEYGGAQQGGATSDFDGNYSIKPINPGSYSVKTTYVGYRAVQVNDVLISSDKITFLDLELPSTATSLEEVVISSYKVPLISKDKTSSGGTVTAEEIEKMPNKSVGAIATTVGGVFSEDGGAASIRGQRSGGTVYYIDGIKVQGSANLPESAIDQVTVVLGGVPAKYGDATGGIINIVTKGPSRKFGAGVEAQSSEFLDDFGYNRVGFNMNGPLIKSKDKSSSTSLLGYFVAGDVVYKKDGRPTSTGVYKLKDDVLAELSANPLRPTGMGQGTYRNSQFLRSDDFEHMDATQNTSNLSVNLSGKIDVKTSPTVNLTFGGSFNYYDGNSFSYNNSLMNYDNNSQVINNTWRVFGRFSQRFPTAKGSNALIKNAYYTVQADYSRYTNIVQDPNHKDDLLKYGYIGKFKTYKRKNYNYHYDSVSGVMAYHMDNWADTLVSFEGSNINPALSAYTEQYYTFYDENEGNYDKTDNIIAGGGLLNSMSPGNAYSLYTNPGVIQSDWESYDYRHYESDQLGINFNVSADVGNHELKFGLMYEQKSERYYAYKAASMWQLMRDLTNSHIQQLDLTDPELVYLNGQFMDTVNYHRLYDGASQSTFDENIRKSLGLAINGTEWIDIDSYDMNDHSINYYDEQGNVHTATLANALDIDMFSADELLNSGGFNSYYFGYDYLGEKNSNKPGLDD